MPKLDPACIEAAAERLAGVAHRTPVLTSSALNEAAGAQVFLKCENFQRCGAFKFRGAYNALSCLSAEERAAGVVTHSSGNHGQALALAGRLLGVGVTLVMPEDVSPVKKQAAEAYGARIVLCPPEGREAAAEAERSRHGYILVHPFDDDRIIAGQGTAARELFEEVGELDLLLTPIGGGGLISGSALAAATHSPRCRVVGAEPARADDARRSLRDGRIHALGSVPDTLADGLRPRAISERTFAIIRERVSEIVPVEEDAILRAMRFVWERLKIVIEPSSAVAVAPLLDGTVSGARGRVGVILSGGNVDLDRMAALLARTS